MIGEKLTYRLILFKYPLRIREHSRFAFYLVNCNRIKLNVKSIMNNVSHSIFPLSLVKQTIFDESQPLSGKYWRV